MDDNSDELDDEFNDYIRPLNLLRDYQYDQEPAGVNDDDNISLESGEIVSDDEDFNALIQQEQLSRGINYPRIPFYRLDINISGVNKGLSELLKSSPKMLYHPNDISNLSFRPPTTSNQPAGMTREEFRAYMTPLLTLETVCDLSESFLSFPLITRNIHWNRITDLVIPETDFFKFVVEFQTGASAYQEYQRKCSYGLWLMHSLATDSEPLPLKYSADVVANNCVLVMSKTFFFVRDFIPQNSNLPIWPDVQGHRVAQNEIMLKIRATFHYVSTRKNMPVMDKLRGNQLAAITYIGELAQYLKALRIISIPNRPPEIPAIADYNVSQVYDGIINPQIFDFTIYTPTQTFKHKFDALMTSKEIGLLFVEGSPGTGKTSTIAEIITDYIFDVRDHKEPIPRILVTAPSNAAADVIYLKLRNRLSIFKISRIGDKGKFKPEVRRLTTQDEEQYEEYVLNNRHRIEAETGQRVVRSNIKTMFIKEATITVVTLGSSQTSTLTNLHHRLKFDLLVVDECGQAKTDEFFFPLHFTSIPRILLIGDPRQLGPTLKSSIALNHPIYQTSIFVRLFNFLVHNAPNAIVRLREQHRMRPLVASMVSCISYSDDDRLTTNLNGNWARTNNHPAFLVFSGESWNERRSEGTFSFENQNEAKFGMALLNASLRRQEFNFRSYQFLPEKELKYTIIPLYQGQLNLYRRLVREAHLDKVVKVYTVDQMQGSECDIAIVSAVRASNDHLGVGFASDLRRLNVAISRAACVYVLAKHVDFYVFRGWSTLFHEGSRINCVYTTADQILEKNKLHQLLETRSRDDINLEVIPIRAHD